MAEVLEASTLAWAYPPGRSWAEAFSARRAAVNTLLDMVPGLNRLWSRPRPGKPRMPRARPAPAGMLMEDGLPLREYAAAFLDEFGVRFGVPGDYAVFEDVTGCPLMIAEAMLYQNRSRANKGKLKLEFKGNRRLYMRLLAHSIKHPHEIWEDYKRGRKGKQIPHRRYLARWIIPGQDDVFGVSVFEFVANRWRGVTTFESLIPQYAEANIRKGKRVYVRR